MLHVRNKTQVGFRPKGRKERRIPLNVPAMYALQSMLQKKHAKSDYVFDQADGLQWKSILESFRSLLRRCGFKRSGVHILRHTFGAHLPQKGVDMAVIRDLLGHHSVLLTEKYYAHLAPSSLASAVQRLNKKENLLPKLLPKTDFAPFSGTENRVAELPLTDSFERCYVPEVALLAGVAKLAYAADSKSAGVHSPWGFKSLLRHNHIKQLPVSCCVPTKSLGSFVLFLACSSASSAASRFCASRMLREAC